MVPTHPTPHLVVSQAHLVFARLQHFLDTMSPAVGSHYGGQRYFDRRRRQRVPHLRFLRYCADHHHTLARPHATD